MLNQRNHVYDLNIMFNEANLVTIDEVMSTKFPFQAIIITAQSNSFSWGMQKCFCEIKCQTNKCAYRKNNRFCNSRCHQSIPCCNK